MELIEKIAVGGGCHWCTEAVFQSLIGVEKVEQGYVASVNENHDFSEGIIIHFNSKLITLETLIEIHLYTHRSRSNHSMRTKYRSAIYTFSERQKNECEIILKNFKNLFEGELVTKVYTFHSFKESRDMIQNYYQKNPEKPFCKTYIAPKLRLLLKRFSYQTHAEKLNHL